MSQRDRAGLMNLTKKPLQPAAMKGATARDLEDRILGADTRDATAAVAATGTGPEVPPLGQPVVQRDSPASMISAAQPVMGSVQEPVVPSVIRPVISPYTKLKPKEKSQKITWSVKLDPDLLDRLRRVAEHNRVNMSDIVIEAVELHLPHFPQPPEPEGKGKGR